MLDILSAIIASKVSGGGSGSSGDGNDGMLFFVNVIQDFLGGGVTADKTYQEIFEATQVGKVVFVRQGIKLPDDQIVFMPPSSYIFQGAEEGLILGLCGQGGEINGGYRFNPDGTIVYLRDSDLVKSGPYYGQSGFFMRGRDDNALYRVEVVNGEIKASVVG